MRVFSSFSLVLLIFFIYPDIAGKFNLSIYKKSVSGKRALLPGPTPLRTERATFTAFRSSNSKLTLYVESAGTADRLGMNLVVTAWVHYALTIIRGVNLPTALFSDFIPAYWTFPILVLPHFL